MAAASGSGPYETELCQGIPSEYNGRIQFLGANPRGEGWKNIFSTLFYWNVGGDFTTTAYYWGLRAYLQMVHKETNAPTMGMIVYTDPHTLPILMSEFPLEYYPNLIYAVPTWPYFSDEEGNILNNVLRTMRYQAVEHFPAANVHMRDADSIFVAKMIEDKDEDKFNQVVEEWETAYIDSFLPKVLEQGKQIVIGASTAYSGFYHKNMPYPVHFSFPVVLMNSDNIHKKNPYKHLYLRSNSYTRANRNKINNIYEKVRQAKEETLPEELRTKEGESPHVSWSRKYAYIYKQIADYKASIPPERRNFMPFIQRFEKVYMDQARWGVFAGFVSVLENRKGIEEFWKRCVEYLLSRSYTITNSETGHKISTNDLIKEVFTSSVNGTLKKRGRYDFGKDERMLLYGILPAFKDRIHFFDIIYFRSVTNYRSEQLKFFEPSYIKDLLTDYSSQRSQAQLQKSMLQGEKEHSKWLSNMKILYPTEDAFLNAINANIADKLVPFDKVASEYPESVKSLPFLNPYEAYAKYGKATVRHGRGGRRTQKKVCSQKRKTLRRAQKK